MLWGWVLSKLSSYHNFKWYLGITVNQLNFPAVKFRGLPISLYFAHFNRLHEIRWSRQTCLTNFENVWRGASGSSDKKSSKVIIFAVHFQCKMTDENPKCLTKNPSFVRQNDQPGVKSFREPCFNFTFGTNRTKMFLHKNACSSLIYGVIFKIYLVPETREQALQDDLCILIFRICPNREIRLNRNRNFVDLQ